MVHSDREASSWPFKIWELDVEELRVLVLLSSITTSLPNQFTNYNSGQEVGGDKCHITCGEEGFSYRNIKAGVSMENLLVDRQFCNFVDSFLSV